MGEKINQAMVVPFGKFKGQPIEVLLSHAEYAAWLLAQPGFSERYPSFADFIRRARVDGLQDTPEHNAMVDRLMDHDSFWLYVAVNGSMEPFKRWRLTSAFPELKATATGPCLDCSRDASTWSFGTSLFHRGGKPQRPPNMPDELTVCEHSEPKVDPYTANFRCEQVESKTKLRCEVEPKGADLLLGVAFFIRPNDIPLVNTVPVIRKTIVAELKPVIGDDFPSVIRQVKMARQIYGYDPMYVVVCTNLHTSNLSSDRVKRQFENSGIQLLIESEISGQPSQFQNALSSVVEEKRVLWPQEFADLLDSPSRRIRDIAAIMSEVRRMNKEFCGYETAAEFDRNRKAMAALGNEQVDKSK
jgi:hypothetical protein